MIFLTSTRWQELRAKGRTSFIWQYGYLRAAIPAGFGVASLSLNAKYGLSWETLLSRLFVNELLRKFIFSCRSSDTSVVERYGISESLSLLTPRSRAEGRNPGHAPHPSTDRMSYVNQGE